MDNFFRALGLKKRLKINLKFSKFEFIKYLEKSINPQQLFFFDMFETNQKRYYGKIDEREFRLRQSFFSNNHSRAIGKISGDNYETELDITIIGWNWFIIFFILGMGLIFGLALNDIMTSKSFGVLVILIPAILFFILFPIFKMRKGLKVFEKYLIIKLNKIN